MSKRSQKIQNQQQPPAQRRDSADCSSHAGEPDKQQQQQHQQPARLKRPLEGPPGEVRASSKRPLDMHGGAGGQRVESIEGASRPRPEAAAASNSAAAATSATSEGPNVCAACHKPIRERYLLVALDKRWHEDCLKCACCDCRLGEVGSSLFTHSNKLLCRRDFLRIFGQQGHCAACRRPIPPYELVMRAQDKAYHLDCFACQRCQYRFCVGDRFHLTERHKIICLLCYNEQQRQQLHERLGLAANAAACEPEETSAGAASGEGRADEPEVGGANAISDPAELTNSSASDNPNLTQLRSAEQAVAAAPPRSAGRSPSQSPQPPPPALASASCPAQQMRLPASQQEQGERACVM